MNVAEIFINHVLYGKPGTTYVTPDGEKLYFHMDGHLMYVEAPAHSSFSNKSEEELDRILQDAISDLMNSK